MSLSSWSLCAAAAALASCAVSAPAQIAPDLKKDVDAAVTRVLAESGVPSAAVGIVQDGKIVFTGAYGKARLSPDLPAQPTMHYPVGSISKQFTAACVLLLAEDGKLRLDDPVARWFPELTRANEITVRNLLSHTSGYSDYAPQDYTIPAWTRPMDPARLVRQWAGKPLDFEPGTKWQYSNTNFVLAGLIVEKASGEPFWKFVTDRVLTPAGMHDVLNLDTDRARVEPTGYMRHALGPLRPAIPEAPGWYFADGEMAMPVADLLAWDIVVMKHGPLLKPESWAAFEQEVKLKDGSGTGYGLGVDIRVLDGHRVVAHSGEVGGFVSQNVVYPDDHLAVAVLTNQDASSGAAAAARAIAPLLLAHGAGSSTKPPASARTGQIKEMLSALLQGRVDRARLTDDCNFYFSAEAISDFSTSLRPLGTLVSVEELHQALRGGMQFGMYQANFSGGGKVSITTYITPEGKVEQFLVGPAR